MKTPTKNICSMLLCVGVGSAFLLSPAFAEDAMGLERVIAQQLKQLEEQRQRIDAQQQQLEAQRDMLLSMQRKVRGLTEGRAQPETPPATKITVKPSKTSHPRRTDTQTKRRDKEHPHEEWAGSFGVEGLNTRIKVGGFVELDVIHDSDAIASKGQFITSTIETGVNATKADGADGQTNFSVNPSRLYIETRTPIQQHRLTTLVSMDFYGDALRVQPEPRLRQVYGEMNKILFGGDLLAGQAWSTFADLEAYPNTLDFQGPNSFFGTRQPLVRWTRGIGEGLKLKVALETPDNHIIEGADSLTSWPDGVLALVWDQAPVHLKGSFIARDLRASLNNGPTATTLGWGGSVSGKVRLPFIAEKDFMTFSATYGEGVGSGFNDQPSDAVFDRAASQLALIPVFGYFLSFEHWWSQQMNSTFVYGALKADNRDAQTPDSFEETQYASANLVWTPTQQWQLGLEGLWGKRVDKGGADGTDVRTLMTTKFTF